MASPEKVTFKQRPSVQKNPACEDHVAVIIGKRSFECKGPEVGIRWHIQRTERKSAWLECGERGGSIENEVRETDWDQTQ